MDGKMATTITNRCFLGKKDFVHVKKSSIFKLCPRVKEILSALCARARIPVKNALILIIIICVFASNITVYMWKCRRHCHKMEVPSLSMCDFADEDICNISQEKREKRIPSNFVLHKMYLKEI